jgi:hypothetical protein
MFVRVIYAWGIAVMFCKQPQVYHKKHDSPASRKFQTDRGLVTPRARGIRRCQL